MKKRFIFDENYNKKQTNKNRMKFLIGGAILLLILLILVIVLVANSNKKPKEENKGKTNNEPIYALKEEVILESGEILPDVVEYFTTLENVKKEDISLVYPKEFELSYETKNCSKEVLEEISSGTLDVADATCAYQTLITPSVYGIIVKVLDKEFTVNLRVVDTTAPFLVTKSVEIFETEEYKIEDFVSICYDISDECKLTFANDIEKTVGEHKLLIVAEDKYGNKSKETPADLIIKKAERTLFTVNFDSDGGTKVASVKLEDGSVLTKPNDPSRVGYTFDGWYQGNTKYDFTTPVREDFTLKAKWIKNNTPNPPSGGDEPSIIGVSSISLNFLKIYVEPGETKTVTATIRPSNATNKNISWSSSDESVVKVENGRITGIKEGSAKVTATAGGKSASVEIVVRTSTPTCKYGDGKYDTSYIMSVDLRMNNCAVDPSIRYSDKGVALNDYNRLKREIQAKGYTVVDKSYVDKYTYIRNNTGNGVVGIQIHVEISATDYRGKVYHVSYKIKSDGTRKYEQNEMNLS